MPIWNENNLKFKNLIKESLWNEFDLKLLINFKTNNKRKKCIN
tara:strand:+ start:125 stop:253 length:129 start_codon:yes stop_codon:yes gene_type:complete